MPAGPKHLLRALALLWARLGSARVYVAATAITVIALAGVGLWHLLAPRKELAPAAPNLPVAKSTPASPLSRRSPGEGGSPSSPTAIARISPGIEPPSLTPDASPVPALAPALERQIAITDLTQEERRGPRGETLVIGTIGLASRSEAEKGAVEIRVSFFDLTPNNEMRPTNARVTYRWLTPIRDWSDPEPKFLEAAYFKPRPPRWFQERLRYGGFVVRVYSDGKLQDERSKPETLLAALRTNTAPPAPADLSPDASRPTVQQARSPTPSARPQQNSQPSTLNSQPSEQPLPNGIPVPGKPGFVSSPYDPKFLIDVRGFPPGTLVNDPNTNKPFRVP